MRREQLISLIVLSGSVLLLVSCADSGRVAATSPLAGSVDQPARTQIVVTATSDLDRESVSAETFRVTGSSSGDTPGALSVEADTITFTPGTAFAYGETVTVQVDDSIALLSGLPLKPYEFSFTITDNEGTLAVLRTTPARESAGAALPLRVDAFFAASPLPYTVSDRSVFLAGNSMGRMQGEVRVDMLDPQCVTLSPSLPVPAGERLRAVLTQRIADPTGAFRGYMFEFTTRTAPWSDQWHIAHLDVPIVAPARTTFVPFENRLLPLVLLPTPDGLSVWTMEGTPRELAFLADLSAVASLAVYATSDEWELLAQTTDGRICVISHEDLRFFVTSIFAFPEARSIAVADYDVDGTQELLVFSADAVTPWQRLSSGAWEELSSIALPGAGSVAELADVTGDGLPDMVWSAGETHTLRMRVASAPGRYDPPVDIQGVAQVIHVADMNGDQLPELVTLQDGHVAIYPARGSQFESPHVLAVGSGAIVECAVQDLNGDGLRDLLILEGSQLALVFGTGNFLFSRGWEIEVPAGLTSLELCDVNNDGVSDAVLCGATSYVVQPRAGKGDAEFVVSLDAVEADAGGSAAVPVRLSNPEPVEGFTLALRYSPSLFHLDRIFPSGAAETAEFVAPQIDHERGETVLAVIMEMMPPFEVPEIVPGQHQIIATAEFHVYSDAPVGTYNVLCDEAPAAGTRTDLVVAASTVVPGTFAGSITVGGPAPVTFVRGDADSSGVVDGLDRDFLLAYLLENGPSAQIADAADVNDDGVLSVDDAFYLMAFLSGDGPQPPPPFDAPGVDPTEDSL